MAYYRDLHEWLDFLDSRGYLRRISRPINKDTEMHPLVRFQFRGLEEADRKGWLFENVVDVTGRKYDIPVALRFKTGRSPHKKRFGLSVLKKGGLARTNCQP